MLLSFEAGWKANRRLTQGILSRSAFPQPAHHTQWTQGFSSLPRNARKATRTSRIVNRTVKSSRNDHLALIPAPSKNKPSPPPSCTYTSWQVQAAFYWSRRGVILIKGCNFVFYSGTRFFSFFFFFFQQGNIWSSVFHCFCLFTRVNPPSYRFPLLTWVERKNKKNSCKERHNSTPNPGIFFFSSYSGDVLTRKGYSLTSWFCV